MPEGDTLHKIAARLRPQLEEQSIVRLRLRDRGEIGWAEGRIVERVEAVGKNLLIGIEGGWILWIHLGMKGRLFLHLPGERSPSLASSVILATGARVFVCARAARAELRRRDDPTLQHQLRQIGPDLLAPVFDPDDVVTRVRHSGHVRRPIADVLLDQRVAAGIGNVYKSEVLFACGIHPELAVEQLEDHVLRELYVEARRQMTGNLGPRMRTTTEALSGRHPRVPSSRYWVYRRAGRPCLRCHTRIERRSHTDMDRSTYLCPRCQPARGGPGR